MVREEKRKNTEYDWDYLLREVKNIRRDYNRAIRARNVTRPLILKKKEYLTNSKIIARGLMRWECIRRNEQFRRLCDGDKEILSLGKDINLTPESTKSRLSNELTKIKTKTGKDKRVSFTSRKDEHKYTAYFYFLKNLGHSQSLANSPVYSKQHHALLYDMLDNKDIKKLSQEQITDFIAQLPRRVEFTVDFGYTKQEIMADFERQIDMWFSLNDATGDRNTKRALDYANINRYLKVYDLKNNKSKITFSDIAQQLYPGPSNKNLDSAIQQVKREYKRAKELIRGGFIFIK